MASGVVAVVRAVGSEFLRRKLKPLIIIGFVPALLLVAAGAWLVSRNAWWWLFEAVFIVITLVYAGLVAALLTTLKRLDPARSAMQRQAVGAFVDKLQTVAARLQTPPWLLAYRILRDVMAASKRTADHRPSYLVTLVDDSQSLTPDFKKLQSLFP